MKRSIKQTILAVFVALAMFKGPELQREAIDLFVSEVVCKDANIQVDLHLDELLKIQKTELSTMKNMKDSSVLSGGDEGIRRKPNTLTIYFKL